MLYDASRPNKLLIRSQEIFLVGSRASRGRNPANVHLTKERRKVSGGEKVQGLVTKLICELFPRRCLQIPPVHFPSTEYAPGNSSMSGAIYVCIRHAHCGQHFSTRYPAGSDSLFPQWHIHLVIDYADSIAYPNSISRGE